MHRRKSRPLPISHCSRIAPASWSYPSGCLAGAQCNGHTTSRLVALRMAGSTTAGASAMSTEQPSFDRVWSATYPDEFDELVAYRVAQRRSHVAGTRPPTADEHCFNDGAFCIIASGAWYGTLLSRGSSRSQSAPSGFWQLLKS
jgi:hypothetical protein